MYVWGWYGTLLQYRSRSDMLSLEAGIAIGEMDSDTKPKPKPPCERLNGGGNEFGGWCVRLRCQLTRKAWAHHYLLMLVKYLCLVRKY